MEGSARRRDSVRPNPAGKTITYKIACTPVWIRTPANMNRIRIADHFDTTAYTQLSKNCIYTMGCLQFSRKDPVPIRIPARGQVKGHEDIHVSLRRDWHGGCNKNKQIVSRIKTLAVIANSGNSSFVAQSCPQ